MTVLPPERRVYEVPLELPGYVRKTILVVLGENEDENPVSIVTLAIFGLMSRPLSRALMKSFLPERQRRPEYINPCLEAGSRAYVGGSRLRAGGRPSGGG